MMGSQDRQQDELFVACPLSKLIPDDYPLHRIDAVLDLSWVRTELVDCYCLDNGRPGIDPEAALRLMLAGLVLGITHDRQLMREAQVNLAIRWFSGYALHDTLPHHSSLTRLRQRWGEDRFRLLFDKTVESAITAGLVASEVIHVDATLIRADVSWESITTEYVDAVSQQDKSDQPSKAKKRRVSRTDPEAGMATATRARSAQPCYKQHTAVDDHSRVVVDVTVTSGDVNEGDILQKQVDQVVHRTGRNPKMVTADAGYAYGKVYGAMESREIEALIPAKKEPRPRQNIPIRRFKYDDKNKIVRCPRRRILRRSSKTKHGWYYRTRSKDCSGCPLASRCLSPKVDRRTIVVSEDYGALLRARRSRLRWGKREHSQYHRHMWQVEGAHAEAKDRHGLRRAMRRGLSNMAIQCYLTASVMNLKRLAAAS